MTSPPRRRISAALGWLVLGAAALPLLSLPARGLILTGTGNQAVSDPGWPAGALAVANLESRVGWMEGPPFGGGDWTFFYRGETEALQKTLEAFAAIKAERRDVVLHAGSVASQFLKPGGAEDADTRYDWSFEVWVPENWQRLFNTPDSFFSADHPNFHKPLAAPRLEIWLSPERLDWTRIKVPANVVVEDARATSHGFSSGSAIRAHVAAVMGSVLTIDNHGLGMRPSFDRDRGLASRCETQLALPMPNRLAIQAHGIGVSRRSRSARAALCGWPFG